MSISTSLNTVDPRPIVKRIQTTVSGLSTSSPGYTAGYQLGNLLTFSNALRSTGAGTIASATLIDSANIVGAVDLYLFDQAVTPAPNNSAVNFSDADMQHFVGAISFPPPVSFVNNRAATVSAIGLSVSVGSTTLYGSLATLTSHTFFNSSTDITVNLVIQQY